MTILVDQAVWRWRGRRWAHLVSDESYDELHRFAAQLGVPRRAFQGDHYDVHADAREQAIALGAEAVDARVLVRRLNASGLRRPARRREPAELLVAAVDPGDELAVALAGAAPAFGADGETRWSPPRGLLLAATYQGDLVGGGSLRLPGGRWAEIGHVWVEPTARRFGVGTRVVAALEDRARSHGYWTVRAPRTAVGGDDAVAAFARAVGYRAADGGFEHELLG
ncbi:MAG: GNAT family N-acetyltransferase [Microthrixaceae bacterium]|nr:GNAT family N-acetyltransferase [Microthrixaceae bacterium]